ncbi:hypothetical protein HO173_003262 [Letharia columbiana]|uniref:Uncharacterized protein n=1 Tax=Letharia columbiana TaxID=112416 RepID=A0A8H6L7U1_9LECA|nr:uncharacterized protein HO173_003262 [Letharia columbiana]KAF6238755.1 hypothetical protein HO173_003262 [Letharia columbiana]
MAPKRPRKPTAKAIAARQAAATRPPPPQEPPMGPIKPIRGPSDGPLPPSILAISSAHQPGPPMGPPTSLDPVLNPYTVQL